MRAQHAAAFELRQLTPALLRAAKEPQQREFFSGVEPRLRALAKSPIDHAFVSEMGVAPAADLNRAVSQALNGALHSQIEAARREVRVHTALVDHRSTATVLSRVDAATKNAAIQSLVTSFLESGKLPGRFRRSALDVEQDIQ